MQNSLREALRPIYTISFENKTKKDIKLCLLPGIYSTIRGTGEEPSLETVKVVVAHKEGSEPEVQEIKIPKGFLAGVRFDDPTNLNNAGYACDQVADDGGNADGVVINSIGRSKFRDFLNSVQRVGLRCTEIVIQNKLDNDQSIFDTQIEVAKTVLGAKGGMDFITLQKYVNVNAFDRRKITIDLSGVDENGRSKALELTPEVFMAMTVPAGSNFSVQFTFDNSVSGI